MATTNGNGNRPKIGERLASVGEKTRTSQAWTSIFRPGSVFRQGYTDSPRNRSYVIMNNVLYHLHPVKVVQHVVHDHVGPVARAVGVAAPEHRPRPEDRRPGLGAADLLVDGVEHLGRLAPAPVAVPVGHLSRSSDLLSTCPAQNRTPYAYPWRTVRA